MLKIYKEKKEVEKDVYLKLEDSGGNIALVICNSNGERYVSGRMAFINKSNGRVSLCADVNSTFGLDLDESGRIKID